MTTNAKPVLVATDLSARSDRAVDRATFLAEQWGVRLIVLHSLEPGSRLLDRPDLAERAIRVTLPDPQADVDIVPAVGQAQAVIVEAAASADCGLILTGMARFNLVGEYLVGTTVDHVVRHATAPVLVAKQRAHGPYTSILLATDFSSCSRQALLSAAKLFPDAALHLVHACHVPLEGWLNPEEAKLEAIRAARTEIHAFLHDPVIPDDVRKRVNSLLGHGECDTVVLSTADEVGADLVVIGTHGRSGFVRAVIGSTAEQLLRCTSVDTLMVREAVSATHGLTA